MTQLIHSSFQSSSAQVSRNIVLCFDGTANQFGPLPFTSILKLYSLLDNDSELEQICYYQPGIGTSLHADFQRLNEGFLSSQRTRLVNKWDEMVAFSLDSHMIAAYKFLITHYKKGDRIYLFGFSRGAFTARILAGFIECVGLLNVGLEEMVGTAWNIYKTWENDGQPSTRDQSATLAEQFKKTFSRKNVRIHFMGLWDSVNSCGIIRDRLFPFTARSKIVEHVRHAVSIDERRNKYKQNLIVSCPCEDGKLPPEELEKCTDDLVEIWFPGNHGDIGGGWPEDKNGQSMANIPLRWMIAEAISFGVRFKKHSIHSFNEKFPSLNSLLSCHHDYLELFRKHPMNHYKVETYWDYYFHSIFGIGEEVRVARDQQVMNQVPQEPFTNGDGRGDEYFYRTLEWWLIEILPIGVFIEDEKGEWRRSYKPNLGNHRKLPTHAKLHWSFYWRQHFIKDYRPVNVEGNSVIEETNEVIDENKERMRWSLQNFKNRKDVIDGNEIRIDWNHIPDDLEEILRTNLAL